jgi:hypothetical protein
MHRAKSVAPKAPSATESDRPRFVYPEELTQEELEAMDRVLDVDSEAYLRWLETGKGPEPCGSCN